MCPYSFRVCLLTFCIVLVRYLFEAPRYDIAMFCGSSDLVTVVKRWQNYANVVKVASSSSNPFILYKALRIV